MQGIATAPETNSRSVRLTALVPVLRDGADRFGPAAYGAMVLAFLALFAAGTYLLTLEADEAWILLSAAGAAGAAVPPSGALANPTVSTGGAYLLVQGLLARAAVDLPAHRAVSLAAAAGLLLLTYRVLRQLHHGPAHAAAGAALLAAMPGFVLQASLATGELLAVLLLIAALLHWARRGVRSARAAAVAGLLLGLACATRVNCAAAAAGLAAHALLAPRVSAGRLLRAGLAVGVAAAAAGVLLAAYYHLASGYAAEAQQTYLSASTGIGGARKSVFQLLLYLDVLDRFLPAPVLAAIAGAWVVRRLASGEDENRYETNAEGGDVAGVLLLAGLAMLGAWLLVAPIPHLRYLWPALACLWLAGVVLLLDAWRRAGPATGLALHAGVLAASVHGLLGAALTVAGGESLLLVYQATGSAPRLAPDRTHRFRAAADQRALASFAAQQPAETTFFALIEPLGYPITYLSGRAVRVAADIGDTPGAAPRFLLMQPADFAVWHPGPGFTLWQRRYARTTFRAGDSVALQIADGAPPPPSQTYAAGQNDLF